MWSYRCSSFSCSSYSFHFWSLRTPFAPSTYSSPPHFINFPFKCAISFPLLHNLPLCNTAFQHTGLFPWSIQILPQSGAFLKFISHPHPIMMSLACLDQQFSLSFFKQRKSKHSAMRGTPSSLSAPCVCRCMLCAMYSITVGQDLVWNNIRAAPSVTPQAESSPPAMCSGSPKSFTTPLFFAAPNRSQIQEVYGDPSGSPCGSGGLHLAGLLSVLELFQSSAQNNAARAASSHMIFCTIIFLTESMPFIKKDFQSQDMFKRQAQVCICECIQLTDLNACKWTHRYLTQESRITLPPPSLHSC